VNAADRSLSTRAGVADPAAPGPAAGRPLVIGLVNNMPDAALEATERQFRTLLAAACGAQPFVLRLIALPEVPRSPAGRAHIERSYESTAVLHAGGLDGLIVTGTEPRSPRLQDEPYWAALEAVIAAARDHTVSAVMSCLAAHAAVLCLDGIERRRFPDKLHGIFDCRAGVDHPLTAGLRERRHVPHSRFNDLPEDALAAAGYRVLARSGQVGADLFVKECRSLLVFLQGHPEYDRLALMREFRRDVGRYLNAERDAYPRLPHHYFDAPATALLEDFERLALAQRDPALMARFPPLEAACPPEALWRDASIRFYANWLDLIAQRAGIAPGRPEDADALRRTA